MSGGDEVKRVARSLLKPWERTVLELVERAKRELSSSSTS